MVKIGHMTGYDQRDGLAARIRAAVGYSPLKQPAIGTLLHVSTSTLSRWMRGEGKPPDDDDLAALARACDVPLPFLLHGFDEADSEDDVLERRLRALERGLGEVEAEATRGKVERAELHRTLGTIETLLHDRLGIDVEESSAPGQAPADEADHPREGDPPAP